jgi:hypothetical protein
MEPKFKNLYRITKIEGDNLTLRLLDKPGYRDKLRHRNYVKKFTGDEEQFRRYLTTQATKRVARKIEDLCYACLKLQADGNTGDTQDWIVCDNRDHDMERWFHYQCVGLTGTPPLDIDWFCPECRGEFEIKYDRIEVLTE